MEKEEKFSLKYLINSAVIVEYGSTKIFVDGIVSHNQLFDVYTEETREQFWNNCGEFKDLNLLLFTHCHNDHYGRKNVCRYMDIYDQVDAVIPANGRLPEKFIEAHKNHLTLLEGELGNVISMKYGDLTIEFMKTEHLTFNYPEHYAINIVSDTENVIFTADMDFNRLDLLKNFTKRENSTIYVNHLSMLHRRWRDEIIEQNYDKVIFYHLPSEERDYYNYRARALRNWSKYQNLFKNSEMM